jgi:hypothetical protein
LDAIRASGSALGAKNGKAKCGFFMTKFWQCGFYLAYWVKGEKCVCVLKVL